MANPRRTTALAWKDVRPFSCSVGECKLMTHFVVSYISGFPQLGQSLRGGAKRLVFFADGKARQISAQLFV